MEAGAQSTLLQDRLAVVRYLRIHTLQQLVDEFHLTARRHSTHSSLVSLHYDHIESPMGSPIVQEC